jgi:F-type H+-transporting ATPase subunit k
MVAVYNVFGRPIGSHYVRPFPNKLQSPVSSNDFSQLAIATLGVTFAGSWLAMRGDGSEKAKTPPTNASSKDEEAFIQYGSYLTGPTLPVLRINH